MKKILIIHNKYQNIGGEDIAVDNEVSLLKNYFEVETLFYSNNISNYLSQVISFILNRNDKSTKILEKKIRDFKPDVVYVHNTWFKASLGIFKLLSREKIKTIIKLHNFRYFCTKSYLSKNHFKNGEVCGACGISKSEIGIFNKYFANSFLKSLLMVRYGRKYYNTLKNSEFKIVVLTNFHKQFLEKLEFDENKVHVIPNYLDFNNSENVSKENCIVYAGRISKEKGLQNLIESFLRSDISDWDLKIFGDGPQLKELLKKYDAHNNIQFLGVKPNQEVLKNIKMSRAVITATTLYEGQPTLLCEASTMGIPSIYPKNGGIDEFFPTNYELSFNLSENQDLIAKMNSLNDEKYIDEIGMKNQNFIYECLKKDKIMQRFNRIIHD